MMPLTRWVRRLLLANVAVFLVTTASPVLYRALLLYPPWVLYRPWTLVTYMFLHGGFGHLFFNMLGLYFFGPRLEDRLGGKPFLTLYFLSGLGGAVFSFLFARQYPVVGASGAVYGVLLGFAMFWPRERIYLWMIIPVEAWLLAVLLVAGSLWAGVSGSASRTAHFAHLGGLGFAFAYLRWVDWRRGAGKRAWQKAISVNQPSAGLSDKAALAHWKGIALEGLHEINREEVVRLLVKAEAQGTGSLTPAERDFLDRMAR
ncbi:MAG: rhomboid family intramembrane serine protease [Longimicrobiales bacterium]|nr:rhomboid family intramembrane serine protease [Longimicrobiales bacterium]